MNFDIEITKAIPRAIDALKAIIAKRDQKMIDDAITDIRQKHSDLAFKLYEFDNLLSHNKADLIEKENKIRDLEQQLSERFNLELFEVTPGRFAYKKRDFGTEPAHYLCQPCYDDGKKRILQLEDGSLRCPENSAHTLFTAAPEKLDRRRSPY